MLVFLKFSSVLNFSLLLKCSIHNIFFICYLALCVEETLGVRKKYIFMWWHRTSQLDCVRWAKWIGIAPEMNSQKIGDIPEITLEEITASLRLLWRFLEWLVEIFLLICLLLDSWSQKVSKGMGQDRRKRVFLADLAQSRERWELEPPGEPTMPPL